MICYKKERKDMLGGKHKVLSHAAQTYNKVMHVYKNKISFHRNVDNNNVNALYIRGNFDDVHNDILKNYIHSVCFLVIANCELTINQVSVLSEMKNVECVLLYYNSENCYSLLNNYSNLKSLHVRPKKLNILHLHNSPLLEEVSIQYGNMIVNHPIMNHIDYVVE